MDVTTLGEQIVHWFQPSTAYVIALSGGVDSAVVACAAARAGIDCQAVTGLGPATAQQERADVGRLVEELHLRHQFIESGEYASADYRRNDLQRCYHCKSHLFAAIGKQFPGRVILTGTNLDDLSDYRPGLQAAEQAQVRAPLAELGMSKSIVRELARHWNLFLAEKPASPCLASRIAYGVEVTAQRLQQIEAAERLLKEMLGLTDCRVRLHNDNLVRIELEPAAFHRLLAGDATAQVVQQMRAIGFRHVTLDLAGQQSGSLNPDIRQSLINIQLPSNGTT